HLLSVTAPGSLTTTYTYDSGSNPETTNALLSITNPDGGQQIFTYDTATGRLSTASQNGGANASSFNYLGQGEVTVTDAASHQTTLWFNDIGAIARVQDALGGIDTSQFDNNGNVIRFTDVGGNSFRYSYDVNGNLTQLVNPLGQTVNMTY